VVCFVAVIGQETAKSHGKLVVHQEIHALVSTTWSVRREA
jgi:hypothetical protein